MGRFRVLAGMGVAIAMAVAWVAFGALTPAAAADPVLVDDPVGAARLLVLANDERAAAGLAPLELRYDVFEIAAEHSRRMAAANDLFHNDAYFSPEVRQRLGARSLGENVALNASMDDAHARLMNSPGHRANLMNPKFTVVGVAVVRNSTGTGFVTQNFVEPAAPAAPVAPAPQPEPDPEPTPEAPPAGEPSAPTPAPVAAPTPAPAPATTTPAPEREPAPASVPVPVPVPAPGDAAGSTEPGPTADATTTTSRALVSVVTEPISSSTTPGGGTSSQGGVSPMAMGASAIAALVMVAAAGRAVAARRRDKGPTDSAV